MQRLRFYDLRVSDIPESIGLCQGDRTRFANAVNAAQRRLLYCREAGDEGWNGTWAEIAFNAGRDKPYITLPREVARLEYVTICNRPVYIRNQFFEYLQFGNGRLPKLCRRSGACEMQVFSRNNTPTFVDLTTPPQIISVYPTDPADVGKRTLIQGLDNNNNTVYTQDGAVQVTGVFVPIQLPFTSSPNQFNTITGIQKDITSGPVQYFQVDPVTGAQVLLLTMEPTEQTAWYRRYYFNNLPLNCCNNSIPTPTTALVTAIAKLDLIPVVADTDYTLLTNQEALSHEMQSARYSKIDTETAQSLAKEHHQEAVRLLNGEITHIYGKDSVSVNFRPFGSARLERSGIGTLI